jgi:hypothetical protein
MTGAELDDLEAKAKAAQTDRVRVLGSLDKAWGDWHTVQAFTAAVTPDKVLALIAEVRRLREAFRVYYDADRGGYGIWCGLETAPGLEASFGFCGPTYATTEEAEAQLARWLTGSALDSPQLQAPDVPPLPPSR